MDQQHRSGVGQPALVLNAVLPGEEIGVGQGELEAEGDRRAGERVTTEVATVWPRITR